MSIVDKARAFAKAAHAGQVRKYTGEPYHKHCEAVARIVADAGYNDGAIAVAWLHDVLEDTPVYPDLLTAEFGQGIYLAVMQLTNEPHSSGNRARRKELDRERLSRALPITQTIKLADIIDNASSIVEHDPAFAKVYLQEVRELLEVMNKGDARLYARAKEIVG